MKQALFILCIIFSLNISAQKTTLVYPKNGQVLEDTLINFQWDEVPGTNGYQIQVSTDSLFSSLLFDSLTSSNSILLQLNLNSNPYYYRYRYQTSSGYSFFSKGFKFYCFSPKVLTNLLIWLKADSVFKTNNFVQTIYDQSGNNHHFNQNNNSYQPAFQYNTFFGKNSIKFDGVNDVLNTSLFTIGDSFSFHAVYSNSTNSVPKALLGTSTSIYESLVLLIGSDYYIHNGGSYKLANIGQLDNKVFLSELIMKGQSFSLKGSNTYSSTFTTSTEFSISMLGKRNSGFYYNGNLYEILIVNDINNQIVYKYLLDKYSPPVDIGSNVIFKHSFCDTILRTVKQYESYLWSNGDTTREITVGVQDTGWYWCQVPNLYGQMMRDSVFVYPPIRYSSDTILCYKDSTTFFSNLDAVYSHLWQDLATNDTLSTSTSIQIAPSNNRTLLLTVSDTLGCFITDTFNIFVDSFPITTSLGMDKSLCTGDKIGLEIGNNEADSFLWNTSSTDSLIIINTAGTYTLQTWNFRGCLAKDTVEVDIHGVTPHVAFSALPVCYGDSTIFIDSSMSLDQSNLISWTIELGDASSPRPLVPSPYRYLYSKDTTYTARLTVSTDSGCTNYADAQVLICPLPQPDFAPFTACQNHDVQLLNHSQHTDTISTYRWIFNNIDTLFTNAPIRQFANSGTIPIQLTAIDTHGCSKDKVHNFEVRPTPKANFMYAAVCEGLPINFTDSTTTEIVNPIQTREWNFYDPLAPGSLISPAPSFLFDSAGFYPVWLKTTALNGCWDTITKIVTLHPYVNAGFNYLPICQNQLQNLFGSAFFASLVPAFVDEYAWTMDNKIISNQQNASVMLSDTLLHKVKFYLRTTVGCEDSIIDYVKAHPQPIANFTIDKEYGLPPLEIEFTNNAIAQPPNLTNTLSASWFFGDGTPPLLNTTSKIINHTYVDSAIFYPQLIVTDTFGCEDKVSGVVYAIYAAIDLAVTDVLAEEKDGKLTFSGVVQNFGKQPIKEFDLTARNNEGAAITETWKGNLLPGQALSFVFSGRINIPEYQEIRYYCLSVSLPSSAAQPDENQANNEICKDLKSDFWVSTAYPNPTQEKVNFDIVLPYNQSVEFTLADMQGKPFQNYTYSGRKGLNQVTINIEDLPFGQYTATIITSEKREVRLFVVE